MPARSKLRDRAPTSPSDGPPQSALAGPLLVWFAANARDLPWRGERSAYRVWVSEVMLQQTQVETVLRYYERFLARFPSVAALAAAEEDEVLAAWSGLGFYRRARSLHRAARQVVAEHGGALPRDAERLARLPGLGRYTVGAILSLTWNEPVPLLDGNVTRVLARVFRVAGDPARAATGRVLWRLAEEVLPPGRPGAMNEALMELGALVCRPRDPACAACPLGPLCGARREGDPEAFPAAGRRGEVPASERAALCLLRPDGRFLLERRPPTGLLASLWELPSAEVAPGESALTTARSLARRLGARARPIPCGAAEHRFSHRHWTIQVFRARTRAARTRALATGADARWVAPDELTDLGIPSVTRKTLRAAGVAP